MSPRWNWDSPIPSLASECAPPPGSKGWGSPNSDDWRNSLALCLYSVGIAMKGNTEQENNGYVVFIIIIFFVLFYFSKTG